MKQYYYLNSQRTPIGPHSIDELTEMLATGLVNPTTLVACQGDASWEPLGCVLSRESTVPGLPSLTGSCPTCQRDLSHDLIEGELPERCPSCGRRFRPERPGIWANFVLALRNYAQFKGRATRAEYWSFILINSLIYLLLIFLTAGAALAAQGDETLVAVSIICGLIPLIAWWGFIIVPTLAVATRRLHDVGWCGWWILIDILSGFLPSLVILIGLLCGAGEDNPVVSVFVMLTWMVSQGFGLLLLVLSVLDSQRGSNKYGPSTKYPLG